MMSQPAVFIRKIEQMDNHSFTIEWNDGLNQRYHLDKLQELCPCAACHQDGKLSNQYGVQSTVKAARIVSAGRYALRIEFTSGCSLGIYDFDLLRRVGAA